jgi:hypothetical protein
MKMDALPSQVYYTHEANAGQRTLNAQLSTQQNRLPCFEAEIASQNFAANLDETTAATGQPEDITYTFLERPCRCFSGLRHHDISFDAAHDSNPMTAEENFNIFADSIRSEMDTIPNVNTPSEIQASITNFETTIKETLDNFKSDLLNLVQEQTELFNRAFDQLMTSISANFSDDDAVPAAETTEIDAIVDNDGVTKEAPQPFKFEEFEMKLREKFAAALDEFFKRLEETAWVRENFNTQPGGVAYPNFNTNYDQIMAGTGPKSNGSEQGAFMTSA